MAKTARDTQRSKVYKAEDYFCHKNPNLYASVAECKAYTTEITGSAYWQSQGGKKRIAIGDGRGRSNACAQSKGIHNTIDKIKLPKWARSRIVIIHEMSHILTDQTDFGTSAHGAVFCKHYLNLCFELLGAVRAMALKQKFDEYKVQYFAHTFE